MSTNSLPREKFDPWRAWVFYGALAIAAFFVVIKLFSLTVLQYDALKAQSDENRTRLISDPAPRGIIYDRNGSILARNVASYNIVITPAYLPDDTADIQQIYRQLSELTGIPVNNGTVEDAKLFAACVPGPGIAQLVELGDSNSPYSPVQIQCNISEETALLVREKAMDWPGVAVEVDPVRDYPTGSLTSAVIGFLGPIPASQQEAYEAQGLVTRRDKVGYSGVEAYFQDVLAGKNGERLVEVDVAGQELRNLEPPVAAVAGRNLILSLDTRLQKATEAGIVREINGWNTFLQRIQISSGVIAAMNPKTGEILAMVSYPSYENNRLARFIPAYYYNQLAEDPRKPLLNHVISDEYPPGSVFKLSTAIGALNEGIVTPSTIVQTPGILILTESFSPNDPGLERPFVDWTYNVKGVLNPEGFGSLDFVHCIAYSSNVCFYKLGGGYKTEIPEGLEIDRLREYARALGYDQLSGIELLGEADGLIPTRQWKRINRGENWSTGDTYIASVGQGYVLATPLQVLMSAATIANNGKQMKPTVIREVTDNEGRVLEVWENENGTFSSQPAAISRRVSPFTPTQRWDVTVDPIIKDFICEDGFCTETGIMKTIQPWVVKKVQEGMRLAVTDPKGTLRDVFEGFPLAAAGKTGTAEYCDNVAQAQNRCQFGAWPTHSWTVAYAPYEDPEIVVVAFAYNGGEGASVAGPMVRLVLDAYFELKAIDLAEQGVSP